MKICAWCNRPFLLGEKRLKYHPECKEQMEKIRRKKYYEENKDKIAQRRKEWQKKNPDKIRQYQKKHKEKLRKEKFKKKVELKDLDLSLNS